MHNGQPGTAAALALVLTLGWGGFALAEDTGPATYAEALAQADAESKVLIIDFFTDW